MAFEGTPLEGAIGSFSGIDLGGGIFLMIGLLLLAGIILAVAWYVHYLRKFNILVEIKSERAVGANIPAVNTKQDISRISEILTKGNYKIIYDKGALLFDKKDKVWYFRILKEKVDLPTPPFNVLQPSNKGNVLKIWQKSNEEYVYLMPDMINKEFVVRADGRSYPISQMQTKQVEGDISYWNVKKKDKVKKLFDPESAFMKLLPYIPAMVTVALSIILLWIVFDKLPGLIDQLSELARVLRSSTTADVTTFGLIARLI